MAAPFNLDHIDLIKELLICLGKLPALQSTSHDGRLFLSYIIIMLDIV